MPNPNPYPNLTSMNPVLHLLLKLIQAVNTKLQNTVKKCPHKYSNVRITHTHKIHTSRACPVTGIDK